MSKPSKTPKRDTPLPRTEPCPHAIIIQSHGLGVESQAILERWDAEPESRPFVSWDQLIVVTAEVGEEHRNDTIVHCEDRMLAILRKHNVRFVELARRGFLEEDGIVVLQDTRQPYKLHPEGVYSLSEYLLHSGTVPQFGGEHRCAMKFKAFVIETWLAYAFAHLDNATPVYHVFGYNADEVSRTTNSDHHIARHNADKLIEAPKPPLMVFGFNSEEIGRSERSMKYDGPSRTGHYPLDEWGWNRQKCIDYIFERTGILWVKSACSFCPFCAEASKGEESARIRWTHSPEQTARGLLVEYNSLCFNPRGHLYRDRALIDVILAKKMGGALVEFAKLLEEVPWGLYKVRRIYTKKGKAMRFVQKVKEGSRQLMTDMCSEVAKLEKVELVEKRDIRYAMFAHREENVYPTREGYYVVAPGFMDDKLRGKPAKFDERWERVGQGLPMNPPKVKKAKK